MASTTAAPPPAAQEDNRMGRDQATFIQEEIDRMTVQFFEAFRELSNPMALTPKSTGGTAAMPGQPAESKIEALGRDIVAMSKALDKEIEDLPQLPASQPRALMEEIVRMRGEYCTLREALGHKVQEADVLSKGLREIFERVAE